MVVTIYLLDGGLVGVATLGELAGVVTGVVNLYVTGAGFNLDVVIAGTDRGFHSVTDEYGCRLRKGLFLSGSGVVDTFRACFFFFLLLCGIHGFVSAIDC